MQNLFVSQQWGTITMYWLHRNTVQDAEISLPFPGNELWASKREGKLFFCLNLCKRAVPLGHTVRAAEGFPHALGPLAQLLDYVYGKIMYEVL